MRVTALDFFIVDLDSTLVDTAPDIAGARAATLAEVGVAEPPLEIVQRILRHSDPRITTEVYGHLVPDYLRAEIDRLSCGTVPPPVRNVRVVDHGPVSRTLRHRNPRRLTTGLAAGSQTKRHYTLGKIVIRAVPS